MRPQHCLWLNTSQCEFGTPIALLQSAASGDAHSWQEALLHRVTMVSTNSCNIRNLTIQNGNSRDCAIASSLANFIQPKPMLRGDPQQCRTNSPQGTLAKFSSVAICEVHSPFHLLHARFDQSNSAGFEQHSRTGVVAVSALDVICYRLCDQPSKDFSYSDPPDSIARVLRSTVVAGHHEKTATTTLNGEQLSRTKILTSVNDASDWGD